MEVIAMASNFQKLDDITPSLSVQLIYIRLFRQLTALSCLPPITPFLPRSSIPFPRLFARIYYVRCQGFNNFRGQDLSRHLP